MKSPRRCLVDGCAGAMAGQMVVCGPHWAFLSGTLREEVLRVHTELAEEDGVGNVHRATRNDWRRTRRLVLEELVLARREVEAKAGHPVPPDGVTWRRIMRREPDQATAEDEDPNRGCGLLLVTAALLGVVLTSIIGLFVWLVL